VLVELNNMVYTVQNCKLTATYLLGSLDMTAVDTAIYYTNHNTELNK